MMKLNEYKAQLYRDNCKLKEYANKMEAGHNEEQYQKIMELRKKQDEMYKKYMILQAISNKGSEMK